MKRDIALIPLSREHHRILMCALLLKTDAIPFKGLPTEPAGKMKYAKDLFDSLIYNHMEAEEKVIFPFVRKVNEEFDMLISELQSEHKEIRELVDCLDDKDMQSLKANMERLGVVLTKHVRKEERILFQRIQADLTKDQLHELGSELKARSLSGV